MAAHAGRLALLAVDLSHLPEVPLASAIRNWAAMKPYLPKASELIEMVREAAQPKATARRSQSWFQDRADDGNRLLDEQGRDDIRWIADGNGCRLVDRRELKAMQDRIRDPANAADIARLAA